MFYWFQKCKFCTSFIKFIPKYFILFNAIVSGVVFFFLFSDCLLLVYRNTIDFNILTLYPAILLNLFFSSNSFLVDSLGFPKLMYRFNTMPIRISTDFTVEIDRLILIFIWNCMGPRIDKTILKKKAK